MGKLCEKSEKKKRLKNFPVSYVGKFYRNLADNVNTFLGSDFYGKLSTMPIFHQKMSAGY